jgi:hypothetical protein
MLYLMFFLFSFLMRLFEKWTQCFPEIKKVIVLIITKKIKHIFEFFKNFLSKSFMFMGFLFLNKLQIANIQILILSKPLIIVGHRLFIYELRTSIVRFLLMLFIISFYTVSIEFSFRRKTGMALVISMVM